MNIQILEFIEGAKKAKGLTVIIDVFRAFSHACYCVANGAKEVIPVGELETAYRLKETLPDVILMGERGGKILPGFDYGNSPTQIEGVTLTGKTVVHTTSAGTQGIVNATEADELITGSFVNAGAIIRYIQQMKPEQVSLVCMGWGGKNRADEDVLCAKFISSGLHGEQQDFGQIKHFLRYESRTASFMNLHDEPSAPREDFDKCLDLNRFDFVLRAQYDSVRGVHILQRIEV